jgi:DNA-binding transcriptional ArsR family regulator
MADRARRKEHPITPTEKEGKGERALKSVASYAAESGRSREDRLIYERVRLGILSALCVHPSMTFGELKKLLKTSDGNLSVHARKLEEAGLIRCTKSFEGRKPKTEYRIERKGRRALDRYLNHMEKLIDATRDPR